MKKHRYRKGMLLGMALFLIVSLLFSCISATRVTINTNHSTRGLQPPPYPSIPDWVSDNPHYSTGAALADMNNDGWLDLLIADGNDMLPGRLNVY